MTMKQKRFRGFSGKRKAHKRGINRKHKDRLFCFIFGNEARKDFALSLYNAINGSAYEDPELIEFNTIDDFVYMGVKNDISFLIGDEINIYEHQSTWNPNMPYRMLVYITRLFQGYAEEKDYDEYSSRLNPLPGPRFVVFYNGRDDAEDKTVLKLSDAFPGGVEYDAELKVSVININSGRNTKLMENCRPLREYAEFIEGIRKGRELGLGVPDAVSMALDLLPEDSELKKLILINREEVTNMVFTMNDNWQERHYRNVHREGVEEGMKEGMQKGMQNVLAAMREAGFSDEDIAKTKAIAEAKPGCHSGTQGE